MGFIILKNFVSVPSTPQGHLGTALTDDSALANLSSFFNELRPRLFEKLLHPDEHFTRNSNESDDFEIQKLHKNHREIHKIYTEFKSRLWILKTQRSKVAHRKLTIELVLLFRLRKFPDEQKIFQRQVYSNYVSKLWTPKR